MNPTEAAAGQAGTERSFAGVARLLGDPALARLSTARVAVVGLGGVGSWAAEALCRSGIGCLRLIDLDHVAESNINRQIQADLDTLGMAKVEALRARFARIAPSCLIDPVEEFVQPDNLETLLADPLDFVIDAIDDARAKAAMVAFAKRRGLGIVVCGAAGARSDPLALVREDLALTRGDRLLAGVRARLRRDHGFERRAGRRFRVTALVSRETPLSYQRVAGAGAALACAGYGSIVTVTAAMGIAAASVAIESITKKSSIDAKSGAESSLQD
ncbi:MAG: ThiF family adenylyltransferase [Burkholderiaceae bacterium]